MWLYLEIAYFADIIVLQYSFYSSPGSLDPFGSWQIIKMQS